MKKAKQNKFMKAMNTLSVKQTSMTV